MADYISDSVFNNTNIQLKLVINRKYYDKIKLIKRRCVTMKNIEYICKWCLGVCFALITLYVIKICVFGDYIADALIARALPLSIVLVAISILFFSIGYENRA